MAFTGVAVYDAFATEVAEDVSSIVTAISPTATPFLAWVGDATNPIESSRYDWVEKNLIPETFALSSAVSSSAATSYGLEVGSDASLLRVGDVLRFTSGLNEYVKVNSLGTSSATIYVQRAYAGTAATSVVIAGDSLVFVGSAMEEGTAIRSQRRTTRALKQNFIQIFREDIKLSRQFDKVALKASGQPSPYDEEVTDKTRECLLQLERAVLMGRTNGNTIGADDKETTMAGIYHSISTNVISHATMTTSYLNYMIEQVVTYTEPEERESDYVLMCGNTAYRQLSATRSSEIEREAMDASTGIMKPTMFYSSYGNYQVKRNRHLPTGSIIFLRKDLVEVANFKGLSFGAREYDNGESAQTGYVEGTYGLRFKNEKHTAKWDGIA
jgi:hypothetical protein